MKGLTILMTFILLIVISYSARAGDLVVDGKVGVGTDTPGASLDVRGSAVFNEDGGDYDFRIEGDTKPNLFVVDADRDGIGFGVASPDDAIGNTPAAFIQYETTDRIALKLKQKITFIGPEYPSVFMIDHEDISNKYRGAFFNVQTRHTGTGNPQGPGNPGTVGYRFFQQLQGSSHGTNAGYATIDAFASSQYFWGTQGNYDNIGRISSLRAAIGSIGESGRTHTIKDINFIELRPDFRNGTFNIDNFTGMRMYDAGSAAEGTTATLNINNMYGIIIDKQTVGVNRGAIWLNGEGEGADIVFGTSKEARIYLENGLLYAQDASGNQTIISPHDPETGEWIFYSKNVKTGKVMRVDMERLVKAVEKLTGEKFIIEMYEKEPGKEK